MSKKIILTGIQPSGAIHIGNLIGAIKPMTKLIEENQVFFFLADYHAITAEYRVEEMQKRIFNAAAVNIACGIDPEKCVFFIQSDVPEHTELSWILSCVTPMGKMERMTQYKDKAKRQSKNINLGLFSYPVLQSADILLYKANAVPVGEDQAQHLELTREIVRHFNHRFGPVFPEPASLIGKGARLMGLDGKNKMSKSLNNYIEVTETFKEIWEKLRPAVTDTKRVRRNDPGNPPDCPRDHTHKCFTPEETINEIEEQCRQAGIGCFDCKKILAEHMSRHLAPIREKYFQLLDKSQQVEEILLAGGQEARRVARQTMIEVREAVGMRNRD